MIEQLDQVGQFLGQMDTAHLIGSLIAFKVGVLTMVHRFFK